MVPRCLTADASVRPAYREGTWSYALGRPAIEHPDYDAARADARKRRWDPGWIRSWQDVTAVTKYGCWFDETAARQRAEFFPRYLTLRKGTYAGQPFHLLDFQKYDLIMPLYGWKGEDNLRRFGKGSAWMPKKNAKSAVCSGIAAIGLIADRVESPEVYSCAGDKKQAGIIQGETSKMLKANKAVAKHLRFVDSQKSIVCTFNDGVFQALSSDGDLQEGLNWTLLLFDELHVQKNRKYYDTLVGGGISRAESLFLSISTAGVFDANSIAWEEWEYNRTIQMGIKEDISYFAVRYYVEKEADWEDPANHLRANPGLGITNVQKKFDDLFRAAKNSPTKQNQFRRYHLNQWLQQAEKYLNINLWLKIDLPVIERELEGRTCYAGIDGAGKADINSVGYVFPPRVDRPEEPVHVISRNWVPKECILKRSHEDKVPYDLWEEQGWLSTIPGPSIDQRFMIRRIEQDRKLFNIAEVAFDPAWSRAFEGPLLDKGFKMVELYQSLKNYTAALAELESLILLGRIAHGNNPLLTWAVDNLVIRKNHNLEMAPDKDRATERIDPIVAVLMGIARMVVHRPKRSAYEDGLMVV